MMRLTARLMAMAMAMAMKMEIVDRAWMREVAETRRYSSNSIKLPEYSVPKLPRG